MFNSKQIEIQTKIKLMLSLGYTPTMCTNTISNQYSLTYKKAKLLTNKK